MSRCDAVAVFRTAAHHPGDQCLLEAGHAGPHRYVPVKVTSLSELDSSLGEDPLCSHLTTLFAWGYRLVKTDAEGRIIEEVLDV